MQERIAEQNVALNQIGKKMDELYHVWAGRFGLSDPMFWVLYILCETGESYTQNALASMWFYPKQTVNSTIASMVKQGYITLRQMNGPRNSKAVLLTPAGEEICKKAVLPILQAEQHALERLGTNRRELLLELMEEHYENLWEEVQEL